MSDVHGRPFEFVLGRLQNLKGNGNSRTARCPAHDDHENSLSVRKGDDGRVLLKCFAGCTLEEVVSALGMTVRDLFPEAIAPPVRSRPRRPITIHDLAADKKLPVEFLRQVGLHDCPGGVEIRYRLEDGTPAPRQRIRAALVAKKGSRWDEGSGPIVPYGLDRLQEARSAGYLVLVEGESDSWTLWHNCGRSSSTESLSAISSITSRMSKLRMRFSGITWRSRRWSCASHSSIEPWK